jgi:hypothetical protein
MLKLIRVVPILLVAPALAFAQGNPTNLTSSVSGTTVTLNWSGGSGSHVVEASVVPGGPIVASLATTGTSLTVPNVPSGTYFVRVRNAGGATTSNEVTVTVTGTGCPAPPVAPALFVRSTGATANVSWGSGGGCAPSSFTLFAGSAPGLSNIAVVNAGGSLGLSAVAPAGTYYVRVLGTNAFGSAVSQELTLRIAANAQNDTLIPFQAVFFDVVMTQSGTYQGALVWDDPTIDLDLYLTSPGCAYPPTSCLLAISDATGTNTEAVSRSVVAGESYRIWVDNLTARTTSFALVNTIGGAPAVTAPVQTGEGAGGEEPRITKVKP